MQTGKYQQQPKTIFYLVVLVISFNLAKLWRFKYFPSADGAAHVEIAAITSSLLTGTCENINKIFAFTPALAPTWIANLILIPLLEIFPAYIAEKILVSVYLILFPIAVYKLLRKINPGSSVIILAACLFTTNYTYYSGNYNFLLSFILYLYSLNWFIHARHNLSRRNLLILTAFFTLNYIFHLFGFLALCFTVFVIYSFDFARARKLGDYLHKGLLSLLCAMPAFLVFAQYLSLPRPPIGGDIPFSITLLHIFMPTVIFNGFDFSFSTITIANLFLLAIITILAIRRRMQKHEYDFLLWLPIAFTILSLLLPGGFAGGSGLGPRLQLYIYIPALLWLATFSIGKRTTIILAVILCLALTYQGVASIKYFEKYNRWMAYLESAEKNIAANSTFYNANLDPDLLAFGNPRLTARIAYYKTGGYISADKTCVINASSFALAETNTFPVGFRDKYNPSLHLGALRDAAGKMLNPPPADFDKYFRETGVDIDFVAIIGDKPNQLITPNSYRQIYHSDDGVLKIYKSKRNDRTNRTNN